MYRDQFHVPGPGCYALTHSVGCLPKRGVEALHRDFLEPWQLKGGDAWNPWLETVEGFRRALAALLGGNPKDYCPQANLSSGLAKLLPALPQAATRRVLLASEDSFPSLAFVLQHGQRSGFTTRLIPRAEDPAGVATWDKHLTTDVAAALVTHVHSNSGAIAPVVEVARLCRQRKITCIVDVAQSAGILPVSVAEFAADVVLGSCVKWLCGGPGAGFMWLSPALLPTLSPADVGWFSHQDPFEFDVHAFRYAADARRFWGGTPSVAPYAIAADSLRLLASIGINAIRSHNAGLMTLFRSSLPAPWRDRIELGRLGGTLCVDLESDFTTVMRSLQERAVRVDARGTVVRVSFHIYNTAAEAQFVAQCWSGA